MTCGSQLREGRARPANPHSAGVPGVSCRVLCGGKREAGAPPERSIGGLPDGAPVLLGSGGRTPTRRADRSLVSGAGRVSP